MTDTTVDASSRLPHLVLTEKKMESYNMRPEDSGTELCVEMYDDGKLCGKFEIDCNWARRGGHNAHALQTAVRLLQRLAAKDWHGASLRDLWDCRSFTDIPNKHIDLVYIPGSLTKGIEMRWNVRLQSSYYTNICSMPDASGLAEWSLSSDSFATTKFTKLPDDTPLEFCLEYTRRGDSHWSVLLPAKKYGDGIADIAKWMIAKAMVWRPACVEPPFTILTLSCLKKKPKGGWYDAAFSPQFIEALVARGVDHTALLLPNTVQRSDTHVIEAALAVGMKNLGAPGSSWALMSIPAAAKFGLVPISDYRPFEFIHSKDGTEFLEWTAERMLLELYRDMAKRHTQQYSIRPEWDWGYHDEDKEKAKEMTWFTGMVQYIETTRIAHVG